MKTPNNNPIRWMAFDTPDAKGAVGTSRCPYGANIHLDHLPDAGNGIGYVDLYGPSTNGQEYDPDLPVSLLLFDTRPEGFEEWVVRIIYRPDGSMEVVVNSLMQYAFRNHPNGQHASGDHCFVMPPSQAPEEEEKTVE